MWHSGIGRDILTADRGRRRDGGSGRRVFLEENIYTFTLLKTGV